MDKCVRDQYPLLKEDDTVDSTIQNIISKEANPD